MLPSHPSRRLILLLVLAVILVSILLISSYIPSTGVARRPDERNIRSYDPPLEQTLTGHAIASKLGNETVKAELGRAAWKLFHTTFARFPDRPTTDEKTALKSYVHLFQRLYPCGECATHFGEILNTYPPQVSSRSAAAVWGCHVHNEVNRSLKKPVFDCSEIGDFYDCGCAEEGEKDKTKPGNEIAPKSKDGELRSQKSDESKPDHIEVSEAIPADMIKEG